MLKYTFFLLLLFANTFASAQVCPAKDSTIMRVQVCEIELNNFEGLLAELETVMFKGKVIDAETKEPVHYFDIVFKQGEKILTGGTADSDGNVEIKLENGGIYTVEWSSIGYKTYSKELLIMRGMPEVVIELEIDNEIFSSEDFVVGCRDTEIKIDSIDSESLIIYDNDLIKAIHSLPCGGGVNYNNDLLNTRSFEEYQIDESLFELETEQFGKQVYGSIQHTISIHKIPYISLVIKETGQKTRVDYNGMYRFEDISDGEYTLQVYLEGQLLKELKLITSADNQTRLDINLP